MAIKIRPIPELSERDENRFWSKVDVKGEGECWEWSGCKFANGYGVFRLSGKNYRAHRIAYVLVIGPIPDETLVCHKCDNRACQNANHFFLGTQKDNIQDMLKKNRGNRATGDRNGSRTCPEKVPRGNKHWARMNPDKLIRGENHVNSKITNIIALEMRKRYFEGETQISIAKYFGISFQHVSKIVNRKAWSHV